MFLVKAQMVAFLSHLLIILILTDTKVDPSLQDRQRQLKRARLADGLNDKLSHRPGPLELVQGNILQTNEELAEAIKGEVDAISAQTIANVHLANIISK